MIISILTRIWYHLNFLFESIFSRESNVSDDMMTISSSVYFIMMTLKSVEGKTV